MSLTSKLIAKFLVLCGVSLTCTACYGIPQPDYDYKLKVDGVVTDEATGEPIEGIYVGGNRYSSDMSDADGKFSVVREMPSPQKITVTVEDVDGAENGGEYAALSKEVELVQENFSPTDGKGGPNAKWEGHWEVDFKMTLKTENNDENE